MVKAAVASLGGIGEYHPGLVQTQTEQLLKLAEYNSLELRRAAIKALGQLISFHGKEKPADLPELENKVRPALRHLLFDPKQNLVTRLAALDALGATGRQDCAAEIYELLTKLDQDKDDSLRYRSFMWLGRMVYIPAQNDMAGELRQLTQKKAVWRKERDSGQLDKTWRKEHWEYMLGNSLARITPETIGIDLLHPLYQVRQGAIRGLASRIADGVADAILIGKIIQSHQNFNPDDLPSPFPYAAFQAIDLALWNLEYAGTKKDISTLQNILKNLKPCQILGQEGAIKERLEWTINRLDERLSQDTKNENQAVSL